MKIYEIGTGYTPIPAQVPAATESVVEELTKAFMAQDVDVTIVDIAAADRAPHRLPIIEVRVPALFTRADVRLGLVHKLKRVVYSLALSAKLKKILSASDEKVVLHFHNQYNLFFFLRCTSRNWRDKAIIAYTNHNGMWNMPWEQAENILKKRYFQEIAAMKQADIVFVLNERTKENVATRLGIARERLIPIANGVNSEVYAPLPRDCVQQIKERYHLDGKRVILQVGSINENKGQARSLERVANLLREQKDLVFAYVGDIVSQEYFDAVTATAKELGVEGQVRYLGAVSPGADMNALYNMACATIFSSRYEGFPLVCIESLSAGVPVLIASDLPLHFGDGCFVCTADGGDALIREYILDDEARAVWSDKARDNVQQHYTWDTIARDYYAAIRSIG